MLAQRRQAGADVLLVEEAIALDLDLGEMRFDDPQPDHAAVGRLFGQHPHDAEAFAAIALAERRDCVLHVARLAAFAGEGLEHRLDLVGPEQRVAVDLEALDIEALRLGLGAGKRRGQSQGQPDAGNHGLSDCCGNDQVSQNPPPKTESQLLAARRESELRSLVPRITSNPGSALLALSEICQKLPGR